LLFSKQNKSRTSYLGLFVLSVSILKGVIVKSELLVWLYLFWFASCAAILSCPCKIQPPQTTS